MAGIKKNLITEGLTGGFGDEEYTFRHVDGRTFLVRKSISHKPKTEKQLAAQALFAKAVAMAKADMADEQKRGEWEAQMDNGRRRRTAFNIALSHYCKALKESEG